MNSKPHTLEKLQPRYLDKAGASRYCGISIRSLDYARARGDLPYYRMGKKILYAVHDLDDYMARFRIDTRESSKRRDRNVLRELTPSASI